MEVEHQYSDNPNSVEFWRTPYAMVRVDPVPGTLKKLRGRSCVFRLWAGLVAATLKR